MSSTDGSMLFARSLTVSRLTAGWWETTSYASKSSPWLLASSSPSTNAGTGTATTGGVCETFWRVFWQADSDDPKPRPLPNVRGHLLPLRKSKVVRPPSTNPVPAIKRIIKLTTLISFYYLTIFNVLCY